MYRFTDTNQVAHNNAPSIQFIYNGVNLDHHIKGYRTLAVHGRTLLGRDVESKALNTLGITGGGGMFLASRLPEREITVEFLLQAKDNILFREVSKQFAYLLHQDKECELRFSDEPQYTYYGAFSDVSDIDERRNAVKGEITFLCVDPLKYGPVREIKLSENLIFPLKTQFERYPMKVEAITAVLAEDVGTGFVLENINTGMKVSLFGSFAAGDVIEITPQVVSLNGLPIMDRLDLHSQIEAMNIYYGNEMQISSPAVITVRFREVSL